MSELHLPMWVIYESPKDYPGKFVVRLWESLPRPEPRRLIGVSENLEEARKLVPPGAYRLVRQPEDDPVIVETWI